MFLSDVNPETDWSDMDRWELEIGSNWRPADEREAVFEAWHQAEQARLRLMEALVWWDRTDAHTADGARSAAAWLRGKLLVSHGHAVGLLRQSRGLRDCPSLHQALASGTLTFDQADHLIHVFTPARAAYVDRDVHMLIDRCRDLTVAQCRVLTRRWADLVDAEIASHGRRDR